MHEYRRQREHLLSPRRGPARCAPSAHTRALARASVLRAYARAPVRARRCGRSTWSSGRAERVLHLRARDWGGRELAPNRTLARQGRCITYVGRARHDGHWRASGFRRNDRHAPLWSGEPIGRQGPVRQSAHTRRARTHRAPRAVPGDGTPLAVPCLVRVRRIDELRRMHAVHHVCGAPRRGQPPGPPGLPRARATSNTPVSRPGTSGLNGLVVRLTVRNRTRGRDQTRAGKVG
jgi:hypothetical protein